MHLLPRPNRRHALMQLAALGASAMASAGTPAAAEAWRLSLAARLQAAHAPGLSWALIANGKLLSTGAWGLAELASERLMQADTLMSTASVTKTFTGALLMQCVEQARCALDDAADRHLPFALRHPGHPQTPITLRHLLTHSSGLADEPAPYVASYACGDPAAPLADWLREALHGEAAKTKPPFHAEAPGQRHAYSNVGYGLLGLVLERLSGKPYPALLREAMLAPLGMARSRVLLQGPSLGERATPYEFIAPGKALPEHVGRLAQGAPLSLAEGQGQQQALCAYGFATVSDGLLRSTAPELARFALALLHGGELDGRRILRAETVAQLFSDPLAELPAAARPRYQQGLTWRGLGDAGSDRYWAHFGTDPGAAAALALRPRDGRGLALLANSARARPLLGRFVSEWMAAALS